MFFVMQNFNQKVGYQSGVFAVYKELGLPVVPSALNAGSVWPLGYFDDKKPGKVVIKILEPIKAGMDKRTFLATWAAFSFKFFFTQGGKAFYIAIATAVFSPGITGKQLDTIEKFDDRLTAKLFYTKSSTCGISSVITTTTSFFSCHIKMPIPCKKKNFGKKAFLAKKKI